MIVIFEGPDMTGKTTIAKACAQELGIPYFKNGIQTDAFKGWLAGGENFFHGLMKFADPYFLSYLEQTDASVILDRAYPSEWVYSRAFGRETVDSALEYSDSTYARLGAKIIITGRSNYVMKDDLVPDVIGPTKTKEIHELYQYFAQWTKCDVLQLNVDDEDLDRQITEISSWLQGVTYG